MNAAIIEAQCPSHNQLMDLFRKVWMGLGIISHNAVVFDLHQELIEIEEKHILLCGRCAACKAVIYLLVIKNGRKLDQFEENDLFNCLMYLRGQISS